MDLTLEAYHREVQKQLITETADGWTAVWEMESVLIPEHIIDLKTVHLRGAVTNSTTWQTHDNIITIPAGFRPSVTEAFLMQGSGSNRYLLMIQSGGNCNAQRYTNNTTMSNTVPTGSWLCMYATWMVE